MHADAGPSSVRAHPSTRGRSRPRAVRLGSGVGIDYLFMAVLGGAASVWGALVVAGILTVVKLHLAGWMPAGAGTSGNFEIVVLGLLFLLVLQRAPRGLTPVIAGWLPASSRARN